MDAKERANEEMKSDTLKPKRSLLRGVFSLLCDRSIITMMVVEDTMEIVAVMIWAIEYALNRSFNGTILIPLALPWRELSTFHSLV